MDITLKLINIAFFLFLLICLMLDFFKERRKHGDKQLSKSEFCQQLTVFWKITVTLNFIISISYLGFCFYEIWKDGTPSLESVFSVITWTLASLVTVHSLCKTSRKHRTWPFVLTLWWFFSSVRNLLLVSVYILSLFKSIEISNFLPEANIIDFGLLPLSILLCFNALPDNSAHKHNITTQPLLQKELEKQEKHRDPFSDAGIWSQLTFRWLNPLFKKGRGEKIELEHIPSIPLSETADEASPLLEHTLRKQKTETILLPNAIFHSIWRPLAINAVFAGVNTIASYTGPLLITSFVDFLSRKDDNSWHNGIVLALVFFLAKTVESLSQRQWYFGAHRLGIRVKAALMVLIYKKSLSIKYDSMSNGNIINFLNVDVERIGDFCWYFHGIWLLPVQVICALVILYKNLGAAPSLAALFTTIIVMISKTPLANMQERRHSKIMEAKDSRIKATSETLKRMRVLKLHSWESKFLKKLLKLREVEMDWLRKYLYTCSAVAFLFWASPTLISIFTFGVCIMLSTPLTSGTVLSALATFRILQEPIYNLLELISMIVQTKVLVD